jgi:hypothetical protein
MSMKLHKSAILAMILASAGLSMAMVLGPSSSGAPASHTGAPDENTCATIGCHDDNALNTPGAAVTLEMGGINQYIPGKTYPIKIRIADNNGKRFGFQIVALFNANNMGAGKFKLEDMQRTQFVNNLNTLMDRQYVTYSFQGTDPVMTGVGEWTVNWKAPSSNAGPVTFYVAGVSANDDETDKGDFVLTSSLTLDESK